jgi:ABC-type multidrug transport system ATPase subunit
MVLVSSTAFDNELNAANFINFPLLTTGKTTTVSVLSGLFPPTSGDCILYGKSIVHNKNEARHSIGICPQHNVLFDDLTVYEHLAFFMRIKGILPEKAKICEHANEIGLIEYLRTTAVALSGGNKRKLSIAIALCGNPDVLILDEPTSAVDPYSRRAVWDLLRAKKKGRVTLLTTHFMDEAELLSDRIAVMKEGKLKCCGSPIFLKDRFGLGYSMTVVLESPAISNDEEGGTKESSDITIFESLRDRLLTFLKQRIPGTTLVRTSGKEVTFRFPRGSESKFQSTFDDLGIEKESLGIGAYGISNSSLEEVFLQLADDLPVDENESSESKDDDLCDTYGCELKHLSPIRQIGLLYGKRFLIQTRDKKGACFAIILPAMVIALVLLILMLEPPWVGSSLSMSPELYQEASTGEDNTVTNVVVGGRGNQTTFEQEVYLMEKAMKERYRNIDVSSHSDAPTSMDLSTYLLDSYNDRDHAVRFGAYVLNDFVNLTLKIDSAAISDAVDTDFLLDSAIEVLGSNTVDLIEVFGLGDENNVLNLTIDLMSLSGMVADSLGLTPNATLNSVRMRITCLLSNIHDDTF